MLGLFFSQRLANIFLLILVAFQKNKVNALKVSNHKGYRVLVDVLTQILTPYTYLLFIVISNTIFFFYTIS